MKRAIGNRKKGMTLVELVVGFALVAILSASLVGVLAPVYRTYQRTRAVSDAAVLAGNIIDTIRTSANSASVLSADDNKVNVGVIRYSVSDVGRLMYEVVGADTPLKPVFDEKYYDGKKIDMKAKPSDTAENTVLVTINVTTREGVTASQTGVISTLRQYIAGSHIVLEDTDDDGIHNDGTNTDWGTQIGDALNRIRNNTLMNVDSAAPTLSDVDAADYGFGNWTRRVLLSLAKLLFPGDTSVTEENAKAKLDAANIQTWAIRSKGDDNCVFLSSQNIQDLPRGAEVPVICLDLKKDTLAYQIGYAKVYEMKKAGSLTLATPYKTLGTGNNFWKKDFSNYTLNGADSYATYEEARLAYNKMPLIKP